MGRISIASLAAMFALSGTAFAVPTTLYDQTLLSPNTSAPNGTTNPSYYNGTGNPQGGWTVVQDGNIELGLRAKVRQSPNVYHSPDGTYVFSTGMQPSAPTRALWNYEFSINLQTGANGSLTFLDMQSVSLTVTNLNTMATGTVNPFSYWSDNASYGSLTNDDTLAGRHTGTLNSDWSLQNSQNPIFTQFPVAGYSPWYGATYEFVLSVSYNSGTIEEPIVTTVSNTILVQAVPEPASAALIGLGMLGLGFVRRRRRVRSAEG